MPEQKKISQLETATTLAGDEEFAIVQTGVTKKTNIAMVSQETGLAAHLIDTEIHAPLDDDATDDASVWSAEKIISELDLKADADHTHALTDDEITGVLPVAKGGTNKNTISNGSVLMGTTGNAYAERTLGNGLALSGSAIVVVNDTTTQKVETQVGGTPVASQSKLNLIAGTNTTLMGVNNTGAGRVDVTIASTAATPAGKLIQGLFPTYVDAATISFAAGRAYDSTGVYVIALASAASVPLSSASSIGTHGRATGVSESSNTWYFPYLLGDSSGVNASIIVWSTVAPGSAFTPQTGYDIYRSLPFAIRNDGSSNIIPIDCVCGWPYNPNYLYNVATSYYDGSTYTNGTTNVLSAGVQTSFTDVSLASFQPTVSKSALLAYMSNGASHFGVRPDGESHAGQYRGALTSGNINSSGWIKTVSNVVEYIRRNGSNALYIDCMGYSMDAI